MNTMDDYHHKFTCPKCGNRLRKEYDIFDDGAEMDDDFESWEAYADLYYGKDFPGLVNYCEAQLARRPADLSAYQDLGEAYVLNGQYQEAIELVTACHRQSPDSVIFQRIILDALFATGRTENDFPWVKVPSVIRVDAALLDFYYEYLRPKRKPRSVGDLYLEPAGLGYLAFSHEELRQALARDDRFEVDSEGDAYRAEVKVKRKRQRKQSRRGSAR